VRRKCVLNELFHLAESTTLNDLDRCVQVRVTVYINHLWTIFQPLLFVMIGAQVDVTKIHRDTVGLDIAVIFIGVTVRVCVSFLALFGLGLTLRERLFVPLAWLPKATVQASPCCDRRI